jgi:hypothetical protein
MKKETAFHPYIMGGVALFMFSLLFICQGWTNPGRQVVMVTRFCTVASNIFVPL